MSNTHIQRFAPLVGLSCLFSCFPFAQAATDCAVAPIPPQECEALVELYNSTDGSNWNDHTGWNETNDPCTWNGVLCGPGYVEYLYLGSNQLNGSIPESLGNLNNLRELNLEFNQLSGSIPESLGNLYNLEYLRLEVNQLSGSIPESLGNLSNLGYLYLQNNQLSGSIPESLGNLHNLFDLFLSDNELCGDIPLSLTNLGALGPFSISYNHLTASDPYLIDWLNGRDPAWETTQTSCPPQCTPISVIYSAIEQQVTFDTLVMELYNPVTDEPNGLFALFTSGDMKLKALPGFYDFEYEVGEFTSADEIVRESDNCYPTYSSQKETIYFPKVEIPSVGVLPNGATINGPSVCYEAKLKEANTQRQVFTLIETNEVACDLIED